MTSFTAEEWWIRAKALEQYDEAKRLDPSDRNYPDQELVPFCDWLNEQDGVFTIFSCSGHDGRLMPNRAGGYVMAYLRDDLREKMFSRANSFLNDPIHSIEFKNSMWLRKELGRDIDCIVIRFYGNERGTLDESIASMRSMFETILEN